MVEAHIQGTSDHFELPWPVLVARLQLDKLREN